ncbi:MAG: DUF5686 and carboxypeptidase regulatory-like domain-containing protein [Microscillaceae bacterium]|nr:DUF5686 and carboxypeptidase regulatory-like domain-containing protein [Microscillaceae bacterium]MDW8460138.1 DUF5686 family protein [Cytophagales bacterium]
MHYVESKSYIISLIVSVIVSAFSLFTIQITFAQKFFLSGKILDSKNKVPIPFAHIIVNENQLAVNSDIDGKFGVWVSLPIYSIRFSCIGYETFKYEVRTEEDLKPFSKPLNIYLEEKENKLGEVIVRAGENPAHIIIRRVLKNRKENNPERNLSFRYKAYNKFVLTTQYPNEEQFLKRIYKYIEKDSLWQVNDARKIKQKLETNPPKSEKRRKQLAKDTLVTPDKTALNTFWYFKQHHWFVTESISERKYMPPNFDKETILSNRVTGLQNPTFASLATDFQPFSFYQDYLLILNKKYLNPISEGSTEKYIFDLRDTLYQGRDTIFVITFQPKKEKKFQGLEGVIYVNTYKYAVQNVKARSTDNFELVGFEIEQQYEKIGNYWFPTQLHSDLVFKDNMTRFGKVNFVGMARSYLQDIEINPLLKRKDFDGLSVEYLPYVSQTPDSVWKKYRAEPLDLKELRTYKYLDSLGKQYKFDRWIGAVNGLASNRFAWKKVDVDISQVLQFNRFEGLRIGVGFFTNEKISQKYSFGGYYAYGFGDTRSKWGLSASVKLPSAMNWQLHAKFGYDVFEPAQLRFIGKKPIIGSEDLRKILAQRMVLTETWQLSATARPYHNLSTEIRLQRAWYQPLFAYTFRQGSELRTTFETTELGLELNYAFREKYAQINKCRVFVGADYPVISFSLAKGLPQVLGNRYDYVRWAVRAEYRLLSALLKDSYIHLSAGGIVGEVPYPFMFHGAGSSWGRSLSVLIANTFQTMELYEFLAQRFWQCFISQKLTEPWYRTRLSVPELYVMQGLSFGYAANLERHQGLDAKDWRRGFWETGLVVKSLLRLKQTNYYLNYDLGIFSRYGPYALPKWHKNLAIRLGLNVSF